jgi:hypothetical protein
LKKKKKKMEDAARQELSVFAQRLGLDVETSVNDLARKYMAIHTSIVPWTSVYPYVSNDIAKLRHATSDSTLDAFSSTGPNDTNTFVYLMRNSTGPVPNGSAFPVFGDFIDTVLRPGADEEAWEKYHRPNEWKDRAYFLALNTRNKREIAERINDGELTGRAFEDMYERLVEYNPCNLGDQMLVARELGTLIATTQFNVDFGLTPISNHDDESSEEDVAPKQRKCKNALAPASNVEWNMDVESEFRNKDVFKTFKQQHGLNNQFPTLKVAKQILLASNAAPAAQFKGRHQQEIVVPQFTGEQWTEVMSIIDHTTPRVDTASQQLADLQNAARMPEWGVRELVKADLTTHQPDWKTKWAAVFPGVDVPRQISRYLKVYPNVDTSIINAIAAL